ncbi:unnamed protein product [Rhizoctonia solani]|uniref:Uncharacterized protein n=1 Tax=Rhizoctonia solani TaxID=456999 RepID=A0A8H3H6Z6_9AGAM|nr:unnamed protein product [Rhizoctonia solani]
MRNRVLRSGREYNPGQVPAAPTRRAPKNKAPEPEKRSEASTTHVPDTTPGSGDNSDHTIENEHGLITFGAISASERDDDSIVLKDLTL